MHHLLVNSSMNQQSISQSIMIVKNHFNTIRKREEDTAVEEKTDIRTKMQEQEAKIKA